MGGLVPEGGGVYTPQPSPPAAFPWRCAWSVGGVATNKFLLTLDKCFVFSLFGAGGGGVLLRHECCMDPWAWKLLGPEGAVELGEKRRWRCLSLV